MGVSDTVTATVQHSDCVQCKRTNIGIALITNPCVLFMDEPTAGLDSYTSNEVSPLMSSCCLSCPACHVAWTCSSSSGSVQVMTVVKKLVQSGMTLCATINSPTPYGEHEESRNLLHLS